MLSSLPCKVKVRSLTNYVHTCLRSEVFKSLTDIHVNWHVSFKFQLVLSHCDPNIGTVAIES